MCQTCRGCGSLLVRPDKLSNCMKEKMGIKGPYDYEYCCICPNGCPDQRPDGQDKAEICCNCA